MRPIYWEASAGALDALFAQRGPLNMADLYTVALPNGGAVLRWSGTDAQVSAGAETWVLGPGIKRGTLSWSVGVEVDNCTLELTDILGTLIQGKPLMQFIHDGGLTDARVSIYRAFWGIGATAPVGLLLWFSGRVAEVPGVDRFMATVDLTSDLELLEVKVPREVYQPACLNTVYDTACGLSRAAFAVAGSASGASNAQRTSFPHALAQAAGYFDRGVVTFTGGPNAGLARTVQQHTAGEVLVALPWPFAVAAGHAFSIVPGCDRQQTTCSTKFANLARFRGQPYVPAAETIA